MSNAVLEYKTVHIYTPDDHDKAINELAAKGWILCDVFGPVHYFCREKDERFTANIKKSD